MRAEHIKGWLEEVRKEEAAADKISVTEGTMVVIGGKGGGGGGGGEKGEGACRDEKLGEGGGPS